MSFDTKTLEFQKVLLDVSNYAASPKAKESILNLTISKSPLEVSQMLEETEEARQYRVKYGEIPMGGLGDVENVIKRIKLNASLSISDFLGLSEMLSCGRNVIAYYKSNIQPNEKPEALVGYFTGINPLKKVSEDIKTVLSEDGEVYDTASPKLADIRRKIKNLDQQVRAKMQELLQTKAKMLNESLIVIRNGRMCLPVRNEFKNTFKGVIHDESASKSTVYIEPYSALEISNKIVGLKEEEKTEINRILAELSNKVAAYSKEIEDNYQYLTLLDIIFSKASYAIHINAFKPLINEIGMIDLHQARHPLIEPTKCVPIDIKIGENYQAIIITGPNTGGKTVALKTTGLLTLMAQAGLLIPAAEGSKIAVFDHVFADIGDEQSIEQSLSSFSSHMTKVIRILNELTENSLVLLDELGSGTDPKEGSNLAISIVEYMLAYGSRVIITTHYADLKAFAYDKDNIINASVEFDTETLKPTYRLLLGIPGRSNAITIAEHLGLDSSIIKRANALNEVNHTDLSLMLQKLDTQNTILTDKIHQYEEDNRLLKEKLSSVIEKEKKLDKEYQAYIQKAQKEAQKIVSKAQTDAMNLIEEIEKMKNQKDYKEHELADIKYLARNLDNTPDETETIHEFKVGETVLVKSWDRPGRITKIVKDKYEVQVGNFAVEFTKKELGVYHGGGTPVQKPKKKTQTSEMPKRQGKLECDLRGFRYEEVAPELDHFIDQAYLAGFSQVYVIHGFGTGAVRKACYEFFKKCPHVKDTRFGGEGEGLNGVTVVYLK